MVMSLPSLRCLRGGMQMVNGMEQGLPRLPHMLTAATSPPLGVAQSSFFGGTGQPQFDGASPMASDVLIKYTYYGDANLDGQVDGSDYSGIDGGGLFGSSGWANGDFNYDSSTDGLDYALIDNAFNMQGAVL